MNFGGRYEISLIFCLVYDFFAGLDYWGLWVSSNLIF